MIIRQNNSSIVSLTVTDKCMLRYRKVLTVIQGWFTVPQVVTLRYNGKTCSWPFAQRYP